LKTIKFYCILCMPKDMMAYGVTMEVDTRYNEMHHKPSKKAAALTQKDKSKFEEQIHACLEEVHLLELAAEEMEGRGVMHCCSSHKFEPQHTSVKADKTGGRGFAILCMIQASGKNAESLEGTVSDQCINCHFQ